MEEAVGTGFEAADDIERAGFVGEAAEGEKGELSGWGGGMEEALAVDLGVHGRGLESLDLADAPRGDGGLIDELVRAGGARLISDREIGTDGGGGIGGGAGDERGGGRGVESVAEAVAGGVALAGGGDGSARFGAVEAGGFALAGCTDQGSLCMRGNGSNGRFGVELVCFVLVRVIGMAVNDF